MVGSTPCLHTSQLDIPDDGKGRIANQSTASHSTIQYLLEGLKIEAYIDCSVGEGTYGLLLTAWMASSKLSACRGDKQ